MDGVITQTAKVHDAAWKEMFDEFLRDWSAAHDEPFKPFDPVDDYDEYVDGKPRVEGVRSFLESRGIELPEGQESDKPGTRTLNGLGNQKNELFNVVLKRDGVQAYEGSVRYVHAARKPGCAPRSSPPAPTRPPCCRRPGYPTCSRSGSTTRRPRSTT
jgi:beta-phosphoglucomutase-like phosphatase (HAD superfamily)